MPRYTTVKRSAHANAGFKLTDNYSFASHMQTVPALHTEIADASHHMAIAFLHHDAGTPSEHYELVAVQSLEPGKNLFVAPDGRWITGYQPRFYKLHPFAFITNPETNKAELNIDTDAIIEQADDQTIRLFDDEGKLTDTVHKAADTVGRVMQERNKTLTLCRELNEAGVICPWRIKYPDPNPKSNGEPQIKVLHGLSHINLTALQELPADTLLKLNQSGALQLAYGQLLSEPRLNLLGSLEALRQKMAPQAKPLSDTDLDDLFGEKDDLLSF